MLISAKLSDLPALDGLKFQFDVASNPRCRGRRSQREKGREYQMDAQGSLSLDALVSGHILIRTPEGGVASALDNGSPILIDVYAEPQGIFVGGYCVVLAHDLSDDDGRWLYWEYSSPELFRQAMALWSR